MHLRSIVILALSMGGVAVAQAIRPRAAVASAAPTTSTRTPGLPLSPGVRPRTSHSAIRPRGRFSAKTSRQPISPPQVTNMPPITGPIAVVRVEAPAQTPSARPRSARG